MLNYYEDVPEGYSVVHVSTSLFLGSHVLGDPPHPWRIMADQDGKKANIRQVFVYDGPATFAVLHNGLPVVAGFQREDAADFARLMLMSPLTGALSLEALDRPGHWQTLKETA